MMKKYIVPEIGVTYFETERIMSSAETKLSELNALDLFGGQDSTTKSAGSISFGSLKGIE